MTVALTERRALGFLFVTVLIDSIGFGVVIPVFPSLIVRLTGQPLAEAAIISGWVAFGYAVTQFFCGPIIGGLSDRFGRRPVLLASLTAFGIDYMVMAFAPSLGWFIASRLVAGITGASFPTVYAAIADVSAPERRAANFGLIGMGFGLGFIFGPAIGGLAAAYGGDRAPFLVAGCLAFANVLYGWLILPESLKPENRRAFDWRRANAIGTVLQLRRARPLVLMLVVTAFVWVMGYQSLYSVWSYYCIERFGWSPAQIGWSLTAVGTIGALTQGLLSRRLIPRFGQKRIIVWGALSATAGYLIYAAASEGWMLYLGIAAAFLSGLVFPSIQGLMSAGVAASEQGELQGALSSAQSLTSIIGPPLMTSVFAWGTMKGSGVHLPGAPFLLSALFSLTALLLFRRAVAMGAGQAPTADPSATAPG
jgi:DHA1 family tetracycline resistance protein-like MFS transporter